MLFCSTCALPAADERDQLAEAMQVSLVEAEERKALEAPLEERDPDEVLQVRPKAWFKGSVALLPNARSRGWGFVAWGHLSGPIGVSA